jgi:hypothetical protein
MRIQNAFVNEQPLSFSNSDFITTSQASSLSNIRCLLVDSNLEPIKFLNPVFITISVKDVPPDEDKEEALAPQPPNKELQSQIREKQHQNALQQEAHYGKLSNQEWQWNVPAYKAMFKGDKNLATIDEKEATKQDEANIPPPPEDPAPQPEQDA